MRGGSGLGRPGGSRGAGGEREEGDGREWGENCLEVEMR